MCSLGSSAGGGPGGPGSAIRARARTARRTALERRDLELSALAVASVDPSAVEDQEVGAVLAEELQRLQAKYRMPLIVCYLQGKTHEEAAHELGRPLWPAVTP